MWGGLPLFFLLSLLCKSPWLANIFLAQAWAEGKWEFATSHLRGDCGWETAGQCVHRHDLCRSHAINDRMGATFPQYVLTPRRGAAARRPLNGYIHLA